MTERGQGQGVGVQTDSLGQIAPVPRKRPAVGTSSPLVLDNLRERSLSKGRERRRHRSRAVTLLEGRVAYSSSPTPRGIATPQLRSRRLAVVVVSASVNLHRIRRQPGPLANTAAALSLVEILGYRCWRVEGAVVAA